MVTYIMAWVMSASVVLFGSRWGNGVEGGMVGTG
jgi:hypothetical protein